MRLAPSEIPKWPIGLRLCLHWPSGCLWLLLWWLLLLLLRWFLRHRLLRVRKVKEASQKPFCSTTTMQKSDEKNATKKLKTFFFAFVQHCCLLLLLFLPAAAAAVVLVLLDCSQQRLPRRQWPPTTTIKTPTHMHIYVYTHTHMHTHSQSKIVAHLIAKSVKTHARLCHFSVFFGQHKNEYELPNGNTNRMTRDAATPSHTLTHATHVSVCHPSLPLPPRTAPPASLLPRLGNAAAPKLPVAFPMRQDNREGPLSTAAATATTAP